MKDMLILNSKIETAAEYEISVSFRMIGNHHLRVVCVFNSNASSFVIATLGI